MTQENFESRRRAEIRDILAADETRTSIVRQVINGVSGLLLLLVAGLSVVLLVLWKSP